MAISPVSIANTPQAQDDSYSYTEDYFNTHGSVRLDVMSNDLGGKAKSLYSLDDGANALKDLLTRDPNLSTIWEKTAGGNEIRFNDGQVEFRLGSGFDVNSIPQGEVYNDSFVYAIQMGNGTLSYATVHISIAGQNDAATIGGNTQGSVQEDGDTLVASGQLSVHDADRGENVFKTVDAAALQGQYGSFTFNAATGAWTYTLDNGTDGQAGAVQSLAAGEEAWETLVVQSLDGTAQQEIRVRVTGKNDAATISGDTQAGLQEDGGTQAASGSVSVHDIDHGENAFKAVNAAALQGQYGSFSFDESTGAWGYALDNGTNGQAGAVQSLAAGEEAWDTLMVNSLDGTAQQEIKVRIVGRNDAATINGDSQAGLQEDGTTQAASGTLSVHDIDHGENAFKAVDAAALQGQYGAFSFDSATGAWGYALDNGTNGQAGAVQSLAAGEEAWDTLMVNSLDGTAQQEIKVRIVGRNDAATISGDSQAGLQEDGTTQAASGTLSVHDIDHGENAFKAMDAAALQGQYGAFSFDSATGAWGYALDNGTNGQAGAVQSLAAGEEAWDTLMVNSLDGTAQQEIKVRIVGRNDAATISGDSQAGLQEDGSTQAASGTLSVHDIDHGENAFKAVDAAGLQGQYGAFSFDSATGAWGYALDNGTNGQAGAVQSLAAGEEAWDTLMVNSLDGTAQQEIKVRIVGRNDAATISGDSQAGLQEDGSTQAASGTLSVHDIDHGENAFKAVDAAGLQGQYGAFSFDSATGAWGYALDNGTNGQAGAVQSLAASEEAWDTLMVNSLDGTAQQEIKVRIVGRNDAATISGDSQAGLQEDGSTQAASGSVSVHDIDHDENAFKAVDAAALQGQYGAFSFDSATGAWGYALDNGTNGQAGAVQSLGEGEQAWDTLMVESIDGTAQQEIKVLVTGRNDAATFGGTDTGSVTEDGVLITSGKLTVSDIDGADEEGFQAANDVKGAYGKLSINAAGEWNYTLDNGHPAVDALNDGGTLEDAVSVFSLDGTEKVVKLTINGKSDAPPVPTITLPTKSPVPTTTTTQTGTDGKNSINGGSGNDHILGLGGDDSINGQQGDDILDGGPGNDDINGQQGNDYLYGGEGNDKLNGQGGNDVIYGGPGNDDITGGTGNDWLYGEAGADVFKYSNANEAFDVIVGFESGIDKLEFSGAITGGGARYSLVLVDTTGNGQADSTVVRVDSNGAAPGGTVTDMLVLLGVTSVAAGDIVWNA